MGETQGYGLKRLLISILIMIIGTTICCSSIGITLDFVCVSNAQAWLPYYPNAEIVSETHTFIRPWGVGVTNVVLNTTDDRAVVAEWYMAERAKNGVTDPVNLLATMNYSVRRKSDGSGTTIVLNSDCAWT